MVRQPLSPERRRGAGRTRLSGSEEPGLPEEVSVRAACCTPGPPTRTIATKDPKFGRVGKQKIEDTGPLTRKRMETFDSEVLDQTLKWLDRNGKGDKPFFCWFNTTAIHIWSHPPKKYIQKAVDEGRAEEDVVRAKMIEHDEHVGALLKKLEDLGVADNTIVVYTTDNGNELMMWPDGGYAPFRGEKGTTWEGGVRVPLPGPLAGPDPGRQRFERDPEP